MKSHEINRAALMSQISYSLDHSIVWKDMLVSHDPPIRGVSIPLSRNLVGDKGYINVVYAIKDNDCFIAYSGTSDHEYWIYNVDCSTCFLNGLTLHRGFTRMAQEVHQTLTNRYDESDKLGNILNENNINRVIHSGHSAGGAVAGIMPLLLKDGRDHVVIDFGTPRYLSTSGSNRFKRKYPYPRYRFQELYDLVPCIPLSWRGPFPDFIHFGENNYTTPAHKIINKLPWWRPLRMISKYFKSLYLHGPIDEVIKHHSMLNYLTSVICKTDQRDFS